MSSMTAACSTCGKAVRVTIEGDRIVDVIAACEHVKRPDPALEAELRELQPPRRVDEHGD